MSSDYGKRLMALYEEASNEKDPEKLEQLISEILAVLEAHQRAHETARARVIRRLRTSVSIKRQRLE